MLTSPYSIYVKKRPLRVAFLVEDKPESMTIINAALAYSRERWGGRYNPIVLTDGRTLTDTWWALLEAVDPDVVKSFVPLTDDLIGAIERRVSPYLIQQPDSREQQGENVGRVNLPEDGLRLLPTVLNVRRASWSIAESSLVLFETDRQKTDPTVSRFVEISFGGYSHPIHAVSRALEDVRTQRYAVTDAASLVAPLTELSDFRSFTYPIQLCSVPKEAVPPVEYNRFGETFHVVVGDAPSDVAYFWNRPVTLPPWNRTYLNQVWLPLDVARNGQLVPALSAWIQRSADPNGSGRGQVRFVSLSLSQEQLAEIAAPLAGQLRVFHEANALPAIEPPRISEGPPGPGGLDDMDLYRATGTIERLTLQEPDVTQGPMLGEHWMADLYIEFRPERYPTIAGRTLWWQLPRLNNFASYMFRRPGRILRSRYPSALMKRGEPRLDVTLLDDISVFALLAAQPNQPHYTLDARHGRTIPGRSPYYEARRSEKGRYLSGLLELFGGLHPATSVLEERYWRRMFDLLSGRAAHTDAQVLEEIGNALRKRLAANRAKFYQDDRAMVWLTNYVLRIARRLPASSRELDFGTFEKHAKQEIVDFNAALAGQEPWAYSEGDLKNALAGLTELGVLLMGVQARCPSCGYRAWHHIDDARQTLRCGGCNAEFPMPPEQRWHYRLNSLARAAHAEHGLLPVVLVLGQLLMDARTAFLFAPCLGLFENNDKGPIGDVDIAVILDGRFVIGEVKQSKDLFDEATFVKVEDIARRLLPDGVLFSSLDREPNRLTTEQLKRLAEALRPLNISVGWYRLHDYKFEPSPVR